MLIVCVILKLRHTWKIELKCNTSFLYQPYRNARNSQHWRKWNSPALLESNWLESNVYTILFSTDSKLVRITWYAIYISTSTRYVVW